MIVIENFKALYYAYHAYMIVISFWYQKFWLI